MRTAILRDEDITRLSVDLPEADRFSFVRAALGSADFALAGTLADLPREAESTLAQTRTRADALTRLYAELSRLRARLGAQTNEALEREIATLSERVADRKVELTKA